MSNHWPVKARPNNRPSSIARSHSRLVENGPSGGSRSRRLATQLYPGKDVRRDPARAAACQTTQRVHVEIARTGEMMRRLVRHQQQQRIHRLGSPDRRHVVQRASRTIQPDRIAVQTEEGIGQQMRCANHSAARFKQTLPLVRYGNLGRAASRHMRFQSIREIVDIDHRLRDPRRRQPVERMVDQRLTRHPHQRFGLACGQRAHAFAQPRGENHRGVAGEGGGGWGHGLSAPPLRRIA